MRPHTARSPGAWDFGEGALFAFLKKSAIKQVLFVPETNMELFKAVPFLPDVFSVY